MIHDLYVSSALATCLLTAFLIISCEYEDGLFGRFSLSVISFAELVISLDAIMGDTDYAGILKTTLIFQLGVCGFFFWHTCKFLLRRKIGGAHWRPARK